jgi:hypothetical protein
VRISGETKGPRAAATSSVSVWREKKLDSARRNNRAGKRARHR